jgi:hypothetical protein
MEAPQPAGLLLLSAAAAGIGIQPACLRLANMQLGLGAPA